MEKFIQIKKKSQKETGSSTRDRREEQKTSEDGPETPEKKMRYSQKWRKEWMHHNDLKKWILLDQNSPDTVGCRYCKFPIKAKLSVLKQHLISSRHQQLSSPMPTQSIINFPTNSNTEIASKRNEARLALYIACHSAINPVDHLINCEKENHKSDAVSLNMHLKRSKCTAVLRGVWGPHFKAKLKEDLKNSAFSLIIDESTDISVTKLLGIIIKCYSNSRQKIITTFLKLVKLMDATAAGIFKAIESTLKEFDLSFSNMVGLGTDNASVMTGINAGVYAKLLERNKFSILIPCVCHSVQLAVSHAAKKALPPNIEYICSETYNWFARSPPRKELYESIFKAINDKTPLKIVRSCDTRWLSIEVAVSRICDQWIELKTHFGIASCNEKCYAAEMLYKLYTDEKNNLYFIFLRNILRDIQKINQIMQSNSADPTKVLKDIIFLVQSLTKKICASDDCVDLLTCDLEEFAIPNPYLGYEFETKMVTLKIEDKISAEEDVSMRQCCVSFLKALILQFRQRLPKNIIVLEKISIFSVENALKPNKENMGNLLASFGLSAYKITVIESQWHNLYLNSWVDKQNTNLFWIEVLNFKDAAFCLGLGLFSQTNIIKTKTRNKIGIELLNSIIQIREGLKLEEKCCYSYEISANIIEEVGGSAKYEKRGEEKFYDDIWVDAFN